MYNILCNYFKFKYLKGCVSAACFFQTSTTPPLLLQLEPLCCESVCVPFFLCGLQTSTFGARCLWQADEADTQTAMSMCWMSLQYKNNKTAVTQPLMGLWGQSKQWLILIIPSTSFIQQCRFFESMPIMMASFGTNHLRAEKRGNYFNSLACQGEVTCPPIITEERGRNCLESQKNRRALKDDKKK